MDIKINKLNSIHEKECKNACFWKFQPISKKIDIQYGTVLGV
jgi:hypothetical protein